MSIFGALGVFLEGVLEKRCRYCESGWAHCQSLIDFYVVFGVLTLFW